jgi:hypothetical protein
MTIADLIKILQDYPLEMEVVSYDNYGFWGEPDPDYDEALNVIIL